MKLATVTSLPTVAGSLESHAATPGALEAFKKQLNAQIKARKDAQEAAAGLVSQALILPVLKQLRRSPFNTNGPFSPGIGEKTFGPQFDMQLADRIAHSPQLGITKRLAEKFLKRGEAPTKAPHKTGLNVHG